MQGIARVADVEVAGHRAVERGFVFGGERRWQEVFGGEQLALVGGLEAECREPPKQEGVGVGQSVEALLGPPEVHA